MLDISNGCRKRSDACLEVAAEGRPFVSVQIENEKPPNYGKRTRLDCSALVLTPTSIPWSSRTERPHQPSVALSIRLPFQELYDQSLFPGVGAGQFCGAICLSWLNPWRSVREHISNMNKPDPVLLHTGLTPHFMKYARHVIEKAQLSQTVVLTALLYIFRLRESTCVPLYGAPSSEARIFIVALMTANKYVDDVSYTTSTWARMSDISSSELSKMETEFLRSLDFKLHVSDKSWSTFKSFAKDVVFPLVDRSNGRL